MHDDAGFQAHLSFRIFMLFHLHVMIFVCCVLSGDQMRGGGVPVDTAAPSDKLQEAAKWATKLIFLMLNFDILRSTNIELLNLIKGDSINGSDILISWFPIVTVIVITRPGSQNVAAPPDVFFCIQHAGRSVCCSNFALLQYLEIISESVALRSVKTLWQRNSSLLDC